MSRTLLLGLVAVGLVCQVGQAGPGYVIFWGLGGDVRKGPVDVTAGVLAKDGIMISNAVAVATGRFHALALLDNGTVVGWGGNRTRQAIGVSTSKSERPLDLVMVGGHLLTNVAAVAAGWTRSLALTKNGTVVGWGTEDFSGTPVKVPDGLTNLNMIASGMNYRAGINRSGEIIDLYTGKAIPGLTNMASVAVQKSDHPSAVALGANGKVVQFANRGFPAYATNTPSLSNVVSIACGLEHNLALMRDGKVWGWGGNGNSEATGIANTNPPYFSSDLVQINGQELTHVTAISAGDEYSLALKDNGTVVNWGNSYHPSYAIPPGLSNIVAIAGGSSFNLAITTNVAVAEWFNRQTAKVPGSR